MTQFCVSARSLVASCVEYASENYFNFFQLSGVKGLYSFNLVALFLYEY